MKIVNDNFTFTYSASGDLVSSNLESTMFISYRTKQRFRIALAVCLAYALLVAILAALFPTEGRSFSSSFWRWSIAVPVYFCIYVFLELFGAWFLDHSYFHRMSSWVRILFLVLLIVLIVVVVVFIRQYFGTVYVL